MFPFIPALHAVLAERGCEHTAIIGVPDYQLPCSCSEDFKHNQKEVNRKPSCDDEDKHIWYCPSNMKGCDGHQQCVSNELGWACDNGATYTDPCWAPCVEVNNNSLTIRNMDERYKGTYHCKLENESSSNITLHVNCK